jgi:hypothetical protein
MFTKRQLALFQQIMETTPLQVQSGAGAGYDSDRGSSSHQRWEEEGGGGRRREEEEGGWWVSSSHSSGAPSYYPY